MEKSIKRVEKLVHATSSTLAQMKFSLMFDDMNGKKDSQAWRAEGLDAALLGKFLQTDDLSFWQNEFKLKAGETLAKIDKMLPSNKFSRKSAKPIDRIKEINNKMNHLKLDQLKRGETKQSRQKLLSLISEEKFSPKMTSCKESAGSKQTSHWNEEKEPSDKTRPVSRKTESVSTIVKSPTKPKGELKNRILETQEVVDRGFQTARLLAQKVESMTKLEKKDRTPSTGKTVSDFNLRSSEGKTESNESLKAVKCCRRSQMKKKRETNFEEGEKVNSRVIDIKRNELEKEIKSNLQLQQLPSLHIRGGLKVQKIHNLEIPASEDIFFEKTNTAISFFSHDQMEKEKMEKILEKVRKENCGCIEDESRTNYVECFNCGKLISIRKTWVNPRRIDEVLRKCDFNVFDPRIDEFVEKCGGPDATNWCNETRPVTLIQSDAAVADCQKLEVLSKDSEQAPQAKIKEELKRRRRFTLRDLSDRMCKKYKEEADALVDNHFKLDAILQNLFRKVEESKEVFESCHLLKNYKPDSERAPVLTHTKPVLVTLPGVSSSVRNKQQKLNKKDVKNRSKSRTEFFDEKDFIRPTLPPSKSLKETGETREGFSPVVYSDKNKSFLPEAKEKPQKRFLSSATGENGTTKHPEISKEKKPFVSSPSSHSSSSSCKPHSDFRGKKYMKTLMMASVQRKDAKLLENKLLVESLPGKNKKTKSSETEEEEEENGSSVTSSTSSIKDKVANQADFPVKNTEESTFFPTAQLNSVEDVEKKSLVMSPSKSSNFYKDEEEKAEPCQTPSQKSENENNYESDFESFTNELEEQGGDYENVESEINPVLKKLPTISEVDSELDKKISDNQKTQCVEGDKKVRCVSEEEGDSVATGVSLKSNKSKKASLKSTESELVTSLRGILTTLQDQFARTESLAEKLSETSKVERTENVSHIAGAVLKPWKISTPGNLVESLQSSRKDWSPRPKTKFSLTLPKKPTSEGISSADDASQEGGSSLGEIIVSEGRKNNSDMTNTSSISEESILKLASAEKSSFVLSDRK